MVEVVCNHENGEFLLVVELLEKLIERLFTGIVEIIGSFVENKKFLSGGEGAREENFLALAAGELGEIVLSEGCKFE